MNAVYCRDAARYGGTLVCCGSNAADEDSRYYKIVLFDVNLAFVR